MFVGISDVWCCFGGGWSGLVVYMGCNEIRSELLGVFEDFSDSSANVISIQARANAPIWPNSARQDFFT